jgi:hypothetical protein
MINTNELTKEETYKLMNSSDKIPEGWNKRPWAVYVAFNFNFQIVAVGNGDEFYDSVYYKAVSRGCTVPYIENTVKILTTEQVKEHNNLLEKILKDKKIGKN